MKISPTRQEFHALAKENTVIPVWTEVLADVETPVSAYIKLVGDRPGFLLESVEHGERWSRFSFVGRDPVATLVLRDGAITTVGNVPSSMPRDKGMLAAIESLLATYRSPLHPDLPPLQGGLMGFLGYDIVREIENLPNVPNEDRNMPDAVMSMIGSLAAFDHWRQRCYMIESVPVAGLDATARDEAYDAAIVRVNKGVEDLSRPIAHTPVFQVVLSQRFDVELEADPFDVYRVLRQINPSPYMYYVKHEDVTIVGSSPEPMVQLRNGRVISRPIAGTRKRGTDDEHDRKLAGELKENPKERAEHVMLVDLARNDVGRVAEYGSMSVDEFMTLEKYSHVMHLTSQVSGTLRAGLGPVDVLRATLPAGTVSGAPKVRAMQIIDALEPTKRGPYAGVVGYVDFSGNLDTAIAIRTMFVGSHGATLQAGAGIVADSVATEENLECRNKAAALIAAIPAARRMTAARIANNKAKK
ncbi:MAG: anthranilate synthase component [Actinomycetota bacterium]